MVYKVYIGGLPAGTTEAEIEREFTKFGVLATVWVARKPPGFAFVEYADQRDADDAVRQLDGYRNWRVEHSRAGQPRMRSYGGADGGRSSYAYRGRDIDRGGYGRDRSPPAHRRRSPSYDRGRRRSPSPYDRFRRSPSPPPHRRRSPSPRRQRSSSPYRRRDRSMSPAPRRSLSPASPR